MQFFRTTFSCTVPDAYMWKSTAKPVVEMKEVSLETQVEDHTEDKEIEVIVTSGSET